MTRGHEFHPHPVTLRERVRGSLVGLAVGDALASPVAAGGGQSFDADGDVGGGVATTLRTDAWAADSSIALCLAQSLVECGGFDVRDQMRRYAQWLRAAAAGGSKRGGRTLRASIDRFEKTGDPFAGSIDPLTAGNGSLMRLAPVPLFYATDPREAMERSALSSRTTHGARAAVDACRYFAGLMVGALAGAPREELLSPRYSPVPGYFEEHPLHHDVDEVACGSFHRRQPPEIASSRYVVRTLEAALWAFDRSAQFADGCLLAVSLGDDASTTAATYGQLAGAHYGVHAIPGEWRMRLTNRGTIEELADRLYDLGIARAVG